MTRFFQTLYRPEGTVVCTDGEIIAAALYMLPAHIAIGENIHPAHYIYAAATDPAYRRRGIMGTLLRLSDKIGLKQGHAFSFLLPANTALYEYYRGFGYEDFFNIREIALPVRQKGVKYTNKSSVNSSFSILWDADHLKYADFANEAYGGHSIYESDGYALYTETDGICRIHDSSASDDKALQRIVDCVYDACDGCSSFVLRTDPRLRKGEGVIKRHGMLKALGNHSVPSVEAAYLSFPLE